MATSYSNIGILYTKTGEYVKALDNLSKGLEIAKEIGALLRVKEAYDGLTHLYKKQKDYKNAYEYHQLFSKAKDSLFNEEKSKDIGKLEAQYEYDKKLQKQTLEQEKKEAVAAEKSRKQKVIIWAVSSGLLMLLLFMGFLYNRFRLIRKQKNIIEDQKKIVEEKNSLVEQKNKDITDSILYAERIQNAMLPTDKQIKELLPESFVLFKPKDIVSGDFYWMTEKAGKVFFTAADCTGHGVPGAFMSMIALSLLNETVNEKGITKPSDIFYEVRKGFITFLKQTDDGQRDGMDAVLCALDKKTSELQFATANNPLYLIRNGNLQETKPDKQPVGLLHGEQKPFTNHKIQLQKGDTIYILSDGYQDQFGGEKGKKFMTKRLKKLFIDNSAKSMDEQKQILNKTIEDWKACPDQPGGSSEQVDDILIIGVRI